MNHHEKLEFVRKMNVKTPFSVKHPEDSEVCFDLVLFDGLSTHGYCVTLDPNGIMDCVGESFVTWHLRTGAKAELICKLFRYHIDKCYARAVRKDRIQRWFRTKINWLRTSFGFQTSSIRTR